MRPLRSPARAALPLAALALIAAAPSAPAPRWQPPPQGAVEMFRQGPRAFRVGPWGAGGEPVRDAVADRAEAAVDMVVDLAPQAAWDLPDWPTAHKLPAGRVAFYRVGEWRPAFVGEAGKPVPLPPGRYWLTAEAPGYATTGTNLIPVSPHAEKVVATFLAGVAPACRVELAPEAAWEAVERLDVVSLTEGAVYPVAPGERAALWAPVGELLAYSVREGRVDALGPVVPCRAGEVARIAPPVPPGPGQGALLLTLELPTSYRVGDRGLGAALVAPAEGAEPESRFFPVGAAWQQQRVTYFFTAVPADLLLQPVVDDPSLQLPFVPRRTVRGVESLSFEVALKTER
ncbi:MAG TPA: carboxypeptidase-like regulatory domain-containing protein [Thermoanaerobaculia bacterium]|nr:carboxypeptidase-like regulatory domain-containing protein [Thermoanaerobaculia bacterium]